MKRTRLNKIGKVGKANLDANRKIAQMWIENGIDYCELGLTVCIQRMLPLQNVHRHKRMWYRNQPEKLFDWKQVVRGCTACHNKIEHDKQLTEAVFFNLRGSE